ncbi:Glycerol 2-dehydrogenase (NADP(+)) [Lachnellula willkommii]|uniref:Glycerol 2-dehydrogenase (NADP(+)) n=1 Tax=Lachnellula willkommii TaxID=215461 RepID=A0A559M604_9HELO|nr:Glycerol 2-dehydrogenase (NADP(+)) [Lachnellula willkommii]
MASSLRLLRIYPLPQIFPRARTLTTRATRHALNTGAKIPVLEFGTFQDAVSRCLKAGFHLIDTAQVYDVEVEVGRGMRESGVPREDIFLATKLWCNTYHPDDVERDWMFRSEISIRPMSTCC